MITSFKPTVGFTVLRSFALPGECDSILTSAVARGDWRPARVGDYEHDILKVAIVNPRATTAEVTQQFDQLSDVFERLRIASVKVVKKEFGLRLNGFSRFSISRNAPGSSVARHRDTTTLSTRRLVTIILYLNDEYEGGQLMFPDMDIVYQPAKGDVAMFLSEHFHSVSTITSGHRYCVIVFGEN